jgi:hypothetical protein
LPEQKKTLVVSADTPNRTAPEIPPSLSPGAYRLPIWFPG